MSRPGKGAGNSENGPSFKTPSQIEVEPVYGPGDMEDADYARDSGAPGEYPLARGVCPSPFMDTEGGSSSSASPGKEGERVC